MITIIYNKTVIVLKIYLSEYKIFQRLVFLAVVIYFYKTDSCFDIVFFITKTPLKLILQLET